MSIKLDNESNIDDNDDFSTNNNKETLTVNSSIKLGKFEVLFVIIDVTGLILSIISKIRNKYNQQNVVNTLKKELEINYCNDNERQSIETIEKKKVFKKSTDCSYISKFILHNRSIEGFLLMNSIFVEGINQFEREPEIYLYYWNFLHGIKKFITINKKCFDSYERNGLLKLIDSYMGKILRKCITDYQILDINKINIQYYLSSLNCLKDMMDILKHMEKDTDVDDVMICNDKLTNILINGDNAFKNLLMNTNNNKESLELYILFLVDSMNRMDLAYVNEKNEKNKFNVNNEKSEAASSSINSSNAEKRKAKIMRNNILNNIVSNMIPLEFAVHEPLVVSKIKMGIKFKSIITAAGIPLANITNYDEGSVVNVNYLISDYVPIMYPIHSTESEGFFSIHPIKNNIVDTVKDVNYFSIILKMIRKAQIIYDKLGPNVKNSDFLYDHNVRFLVENSKGQFGSQLLSSMSIIEKFIVDQITEISEKYDIDNKNLINDENKNKKPDIKKIKISEIFVKDKYYFSEELKSGKYGGKPSSVYKVFYKFNHNPGCQRNPFSLWKCDLRVFDELYTEEIANSPTDYIMIEYLSKVGDLISSIPEKQYNLRDQNELKQLVNDILSNPYIIYLRKLSEDIQGQMDQMNTIGFKYLSDNISDYKTFTLICHLISTFTIMISFHIFIRRSIKRQLRTTDCLNSIMFSIPPAIYNKIPKLKK
ncbi:hypothetical protein U3516DRAFT_734312 [Neocallimastix sp. 'constans']